MAETGSTAETPKIPDHWKFPERDNRRGTVEITVLDEPRGYLALSLKDSHGERSVEHFFNQGDGISQAMREKNVKDKSVSVRLKTGEAELLYDLGPVKYNQGLVVFLRELKKMPPLTYQSLQNMIAIDVSTFLIQE